MSTRLPSPPRAPLIYDGPRLSDLIAEADQLAADALQLQPDAAPRYTLDGNYLMRDGMAVLYAALPKMNPNIPPAARYVLLRRIADLLNQHGEG